MQQSPWLIEAWRELGQRERAGAADNPRILAFYRDAGHPSVRHDETAWCAAFAGACLERVGIASTRSLMARSYSDWGEALAEARSGAIAVLSRGSDPAFGHVGFVVGETQSQIILLGGNQGDAVTVAAFDRSRVIALRWPASEAAPAEAPAPVSDDAGFQRALAHVLEMEGGWSEDPHDPGGATNFGITIGDYASWRGVRLDERSYASVRADLKRIAPETVREIYRRRYWDAAHCATLPAALAFMHFDAAVNHGLGGAARSLQEAAGTVIDGEIGPLTLEAARRAVPGEALARYAAIRRRRYRALPHFWRFGKGWLRRVDVTLARAQDIAGLPTATVKDEGEITMIDTATTKTEPKWWGRSLTIWGTLITALSTVLPALAPLAGLDLTPEVVREAGHHLVGTAQGLAGLLGTLMALFGRLRAQQPLSRRDVSLKL